MRKLLIAATAAAMLAAPAFAASTTVSFAGEDGVTHVWTMGDDGKATAPDGTVVDYAYDEETLTLCAQVPETGEVCVTFEEPGKAVGDASKYTDTNGLSGIATIMAVEE